MTFSHKTITISLDIGPVNFSILEGGDAEISAGYPAGFKGGVAGSTLDNLQAGAAGEKFEHTTLYPGFADVADDEGFTVAAKAFRRIAEVEVWHEIRYNNLIRNVEGDQVFKKDTPVKWKCINRGRVHEGTEPQKKCPTCQKPQFEVVGYARSKNPVDPSFQQCGRTTPPVRMDKDQAIRLYGPDV